MRSSYFWMILMVSAFGILVNARKKKPRSCKGKNGQTYAVGKGYVEDCITYTCFKNGKMKAKGEKCPEIICKGKNGGLYKVGEGYSEKCISYTCSMSGFMTATQVPGCSLPTTPLITTTTPSGTEAPNCMSCAYENRVYQLGDTITIKEKCTILTCVGGNVGLHWTIDVLGASCCQFNGKLLKEGEQVQLYNEQVAKCCKGEMVSAINDTVILRSGCLFGPKDNSRLYPLNSEIKDGCIYYKCQFGIDQEFSDEFDQMVNYTFVPIKEDETCCSSNEGMVPNGWVGNENYVDFSCINGNMTVNFTTTETHFDDEYPLSKEDLDYNLDTYVNYCLSSQEDDQNLIENMRGEMRNTASICNDAVPYTTNSTETNCETCESMVQGQKCGQNGGPFYMNCIDCCGTSSSQCTEWRCDAGGWLCRKPCPQDWTIIQRRGQYGNAEDYFDKDFNDYENGFGSVDDELWIGLKHLTALTKDGEWELRVDLTDWDNKTYYAKYGTFSVGPAPTYKLHVEGFDDANSTLGDSMEYHNGQSFSARNNDQDSISGNCAVSWRGGWWYKSCHYSNLNGLNYAKKVDNAKGISWYHGKARGSNYLSWKASVMKIRKVQDSHLDGWTSLATGNYRFVNARTFQEAIINCGNEGGYLVEIESQEEQDELSQFLEESKLRSYIWLGGTDVEREGKWVGNYSGREIMKFNAWYSGYPRGGLDENCVHTSFRHKFKWDDIGCSYTTNGVGLCEYPDQNGTSTTVNPIPRPDPCLNGWTNLSTGCYRFVKAGSYQEATTNCNNEGGYLVEIDTQEEQDDLALFYEDSKLRSYVWLGGTDENREGQWIGNYSGREIIKFNAWYYGSPNGGFGRNCLITYYSWSFKWIDYSCSYTRSGAVALCEYPDKNAPIVNFTSPVIDQCQYGWTNLSTGCYRLIKARSHQEATTNCNNEGGYLVEIDTQEEQDNLSLFYEDSKLRSYVFLGGTDENIEGQWIGNYSGREIMRFNPSGGLDENCLITHYQWKLKLEDTSCAFTHYDSSVAALCEYPDENDPPNNSSTAVIDSCVSRWSSLTTGCYRLVKAGSYQEAITNCQNEGGYLVEIETQEEQDALAPFLQDSKLKQMIFFGGTDEEREGRWVGSYSRKEIMKFNGWRNGNPGKGVYGNCVHTYYYYQFKWYDFDCSWKGNAAALCEYPDQNKTITTPDPGTAFIWEQEITTVFIRHKGKNYKCDLTFEFSVDNVSLIVQFRNTDSNCADYEQEEEYIESLGEHSFVFTSPSGLRMDCSVNVAIANEALSQPVIEDSLHCIATNNCLTGWTSLATGCYQLVKAGSHQEAMTNCENEGGFLVEIDSQEEQDALVQFLEESKLRSYIWLGGSDQGIEGQWIGNYSGQEIMKFNAWRYGYPGGGFDENCVRTYSGIQFKWDDCRCSYMGNNAALCEYPNQNDSSVSSSTTTVDISEDCDSGWSSLTTGCYKFVKVGSYQEALTNCSNEGGYLVEIETQEEQDALTQFHQDSQLRSTVWLGGTDEEREGQWVGSHSGEVMSFTSWSSGQPAGGFNENCIATDPHYKFKWNDLSCSWKGSAAALCEMPRKNQYSTTTSGAGKETTMTVSTPTPSNCPVCTTALLTTSECPACPSSTPTSCPTPEICPTPTNCPSPTICPICTDSTPSTCSTEVPPMTGSCPVCPDPVIPTLIPDTCFDTGCKNAFNGLGMCVDTSTVNWETVSKIIDFSAGTKDGECSKDCNCKCFKHTGCYSQECDENFGICLIPEQEEKRGFFIPAEYKKAFACDKSLDCFCYIKNYAGVTQPSDVVTKPRSNSSCKANKKCAKKKGKCFGKGDTVPKDAKRRGWCNKKAGCKCYKV